MTNGNTINILLVEDEEFDVKRVMKLVELSKIPFGKCQKVLVEMFVVPWVVLKDVFKSEGVEQIELNEQLVKHLWVDVYLLIKIVNVNVLNIGQQELFGVVCGTFVKYLVNLIYQTVLSVTVGTNVIHLKQF